MSIHQVLVVDDNPNSVEHYTEILASMDLDVQSASGGRSASIYLEAEQFDLALVSSQAAGFDRDTLVAQLKAKRPQMQVVVLLTPDQVGVAGDYLDQGARLCLPLPVDAYTLKKAVDECASDAPITLHSVPDEVITATEVFPPHASHPVIAAVPKTDQTMMRIIGSDPRTLKIYDLARQVANSSTSVMIQGESGTGKELMARYLHAHSPRADRPFVAVNCAAIAPNLLESELFGHEKGSFTGAVRQHMGRFEQAHGGTLLLDEISEMDLGLQAKLLRVLQEGEIDRVGGSGPVKIDVRIVATTNRNLRQMVEDGSFRRDLYYRINVFPLKLFPLRERHEDIAILAEYFAEDCAIRNQRPRPRFSPSAIDRLRECRWPGNIRELQNSIERTVLLCDASVIEAKHIVLDEPQGQAEPISLPNISGPKWEGKTLAEIEQEVILSTLSRLNGNRTRTSQLLGISIRTLRNKLRDYRAMGLEVAAA